MTINSYLPNLWQFNNVSLDWIVFKLGEQKGLISTVFFEARKAETATLKSFPGIMQSFDYILSYLRMNIFIPLVSLFPLGKLFFLFQVTRKRNIGRHNIFPIQRAREQATFSRSNPIFKIAQTSIVKMSARLQPFQQKCLLFGVWIDSISVVHSKHILMLPYLARFISTLKSKIYSVRLLAH